MFIYFEFIKEGLTGVYDFNKRLGKIQKINNSFIYFENKIGIVTKKVQAGTEEACKELVMGYYNHQ